MRRLVPLLLVALLMVLPACRGSFVPKEPEEEVTTAEVLGALDREGLDLNEILDPGDPLFPPPLTAVRTETGDVLQVYEYDSTQAAALDVSQLNPNPTSGRTYYRLGNIVVVHVGQDGEVISTLEEVLGPPVL